MHSPVGGQLSHLVPLGCSPPLGSTPFAQKRLYHVKPVLYHCWPPYGEMTVVVPEGAMMTFIVCPVTVHDSSEQVIKTSHLLNERS
jgi:hypothetical protein